MQTAWPRGAQRHRPRASATAGITKGTAHGIASATTVSAGRRSHRKVVPLFCTSLPPGSVRRAAATVGTVFRCVASRNRERVFYWGSLRLISNRACGQKSGSASLASHTPSGPNPLGEYQSLSSPPLEPRGLLLSVMRQKVGKERSQGGFAPLANPHRFLACHLRKFGPSPTPLKLCKTPVGVPSGTAEAGDSTNHNSPAGRPVANHRRKHSSSGAVPLGTRTGQPPPQAEAGDAKHRDGFRRYFRPKARPSSPDGGHRYPTQQACAARHPNRAASTPNRGRRLGESRPAPPKARPGSPDDGPSPPPATGPQHSLRSFAPAQATDRKTAPPNSHCPRAGGEISP